MNKLITIILIAVFFNTAWAEVEIDYYDNGQKKSEENYKDDKRHGLWTQWYENGQKYYEDNYKDNKKHGLETYWHENGNKRSEENYKDDKRHGLATGWFENGNKRYEGNSKNGKKHGSVTLWHKNGQKRGETNYKDNKKHGLHTFWHENGQKKGEINYNNGIKQRQTASNSNDLGIGSMLLKGFIGAANLYMAKESGQPYDPNIFNPSANNSYNSSSNYNSYNGGSSGGNPCSEENARTEQETANMSEQDSLCRVLKSSNIALKYTKICLAKHSNKLTSQQLSGTKGSVAELNRVIVDTKRTIRQIRSSGACGYFW